MKTTLFTFIIVTVISLGCNSGTSHSVKHQTGKDSNIDEVNNQVLPSENAYKVRIACVGNSITQGSHLKNPDGDCYPSQLREMLTDVYGDTCIVNNYGLSGRNMLKKGRNPIWKESKFKEALSWAPDICFILLGTNDARPILWEKYGNEFLADYLAMIDTFKTQNPATRFIIGAPTPIWAGHPYGGETWTEKHNDSIMVHHVIPIINKVSDKTGAVLIDFHTPFEDSISLFPDHLHPNPEGANKIARLIFETIEGKSMVEAIIQSK